MPRSTLQLQSEEERLARLRNLVVLDSEPEAVFDSIAQLASQVCEAPIALISLVDEERQWFKANVGLPGVNETPRDVAFCAHAIQGHDVFEVPDATRDDRFSRNPLVTGGPDIRFYAGAPLEVDGGARVGTLCVIDRQPRQLSAEQAETLRSLARIATQALEMRRDLINKSLAVRTEYSKALEDSEARHRALVEEQSDLVGLCRPTGELVYANPAYARQFGRSPEEMVGTNLFDRVEANDKDKVRARLLAVFETGTPHTGENRILNAEGKTVWVAWTTRLQRGADGSKLLHSVGRDVTDRKAAEEALWANQQFLYRTGQVAGVGGWEVDVATSQVTWSDQTRLIHEVDDDFFPTLHSAIEFYAPESRPLIQEAVETGIRTGEPWDLELRFITAKGRPIWVRSVGEVLFDHGQPVKLVGAFQDVTARKDLEHMLAQRSATLGAVIEALPAHVCVVDGSGRVQFANRSFERWACPTPRDFFLGVLLRDILDPADYERCRPWAAKVLSGETVSFDVPFHNRVTLSVTLVPLRDGRGATEGFVLVAHDISRHRLEEDRLLQLSQRDPLTGLLNRSGLESHVTKMVQAGEGESLAVLAIDLDRFKPVNDLHGHATGDELLRAFAHRLGKLVRPTDAVARLGGDEFAVVLSGIGQASHADAVADKIIAAVDKPFQVGALELSIGASIGVACSVRPGEPWTALLEKADALLYDAKRAGRGRRVS
ncbi:hypothetical protein GCM10007320_54140 [Pseudorhodoferax aquiterrae]|uniref:PAS domain S-box-containing protein/diguanylate cyclase (GGDEF)-like protein n=1 Tax=Pseudorhodoferax aquiterrae TaxID=747304 RepID=A0ABQ3GAN5_9BURK|nr:diguanylate cyclase [Pseudorhodoferax aquiterrae]GHC98439.1 hypothetical protein GCM10007320_54140 [Pseudorhodoferax aquiterrae]